MASNSEHLEAWRKLVWLVLSKKIERLWDLYLESKGDQLKGGVTDKNRFDLHLRKSFGEKTPEELVPLDVDRLRRQVAKDHRVATTRNVLELLRRIINFGVRQRLCCP